MYFKKVEVKNKSGLHARPGSEFVALASKFKATIKVYRVDKPNRIANAKSLIFILSLGIQQGSVIEIMAEGSDEIQAVDQLVRLVENEFGE